MGRNWDERYATGDIRWDRSEPDPELVRLVQANCLPQGRALDIGCGTGVNTRYLAIAGYETLGIDLSKHAIEQAKQAGAAAGVVVQLQEFDFLGEELRAGPFDLVFDRACFHVFDHSDRARYAERVAQCLASEGLWVSLCGSTEGPPRDAGPPRRHASEVVAAVEPALQIVELREFNFDADEPNRVDGWVLTARRRAVPAQPTTVWEPR